MMGEELDQRSDRKMSSSKNVHTVKRESHTNTYATRDVISKMLKGRRGEPHCRDSALESSAKVNTMKQG